MSVLLIDNNGKYFVTSFIHIIKRILYYAKLLNKSKIQIDYVYLNANGESHSNIIFSSYEEIGTPLISVQGKSLSDLIVNKKTEQYDLLIINDPSYFILEDYSKLNENNLSIILDYIKNYKMTIVACYNNSNYIHNYLIEHDYSNFKSIDIDNMVYELYDKYKSEDIILTPSSIISNSTTLRNSKNKQQTHKFQEMKFVLLDDIDENCEVVDTSITIQELREKINDMNFIKTYKKSLLQLFQYKLEFYNNKIKVFDEKIKRIEKRKNSTKRTDISDVIQEYPAMLSFIIDSDEIINCISLDMKITNKKIQKDLIDAIEDNESGLKSIIGRDPIKNLIASLIYGFSKNYKFFTKNFNNIALLGKSGVGKTQIAKVISFVLSKSHILIRGDINISTRSDLVGGYMGQTALLTKSKLTRSLEGILFIDEAYQLASRNNGVNHKDYGFESITEIVNFTSEYIGMIIVIVAGYTEPMNNEFFTMNEGLSRRFRHRIELNDYDATDLTNILIRDIEEQTDVKIEQEIGNLLYTLIHKNIDRFPKQGGDMLNLSSVISKYMFTSFNLNWENDKDKIILLSFQKFFEEQRKN